MKKLKSMLATLAMLLCAISASAHDFEVDGIYYNITDSIEQTIEVTYKGRYTNSYKEYDGDVVIPDFVHFNNKKYFVTKIGSHAFYECDGLSSISIPNGITAIGSSAFRDCTNLNSVTVPNNVKSIGQSAFSGCKNMTSIIIPNSLTDIGGGAFYECKSLKNINIPNSVVNIGVQAFMGCSALTNISIPNSVTSIGGSAFDGCNGLVKVYINTKNIDDWFSDIKSIKEVVLGDSVKTLNHNTFNSCTGLESVTLGKNINKICSNAFLYCKSLSSVHIPNLENWFNIEFDNFDSNPLYYSKHLFIDGNEINNIIIPNNVLTINDYALSGYSGFLVIPNNIKNIHAYAFDKCSIPSMDINTTQISSSFKNLTTLKEVVLGDSVKDILDNAFSGCKDLTSITIGRNLATIGRDAFNGCSQLSSVYITDIAAWCKIKFASYTSSPFNYAKHFYIDGKLVKNLTIPDCVTDIANYAFYGININTLVIGTGVLSIGSDQKAPIKTIWLTNTPPNGYSRLAGKVNYVANEQYGNISNKKIYKHLSSMFEVDGIIYIPLKPSERTCDVVSCTYDSTQTEIKVDNTVLYKNINMAVNKIMPYSFYGNKFVMSLTLGSNIESLGDYAFSGCEQLKGIKIPSATLRIGNYCFENCKLISDLTIPKSTTSIADYAFKGCTGLKKLVIEDRETTLKLGSNSGNPLFADCPLDYVYIGGDISYSTSSSYGYSPFYRNTLLREVVITDKETEISANEFYGCTNLQNFTVGDGVTTFGDWAFSGCSSLKKLSFGSQLKTIGKEAFSDCVAVTEITSKATTPPTCGSMALDDINKWECTLNIPKGCSAAYQAAEQWKEFFFITEGEEGEPVVPEKICATPTISYINGELVFESETEDVVYHSTITDTDINSYDTNKVQLNVTYNISVYATKADYKNSEVAKATLCWIDVEPKSEGLTNTDIANVKALPVVVQANNGTITVTGANDGTMVEVYGISGTKLGEAKTAFNTATIHTDAQTGSVVIVKVGNKAIKIKI